MATVSPACTAVASHMYARPLTTGTCLVDCPREGDLLSERLTKVEAQHDTTGQSDLTEEG
ncbi:hypothetical protein [Streptomyces sp. NPDC046870]|uniref:hypothetical protein n=1 Tax=Streptomyces sp. NPDC046870 TaxID=3155135 RepID=UPI0034537D41